MELILWRHAEAEEGDAGLPDGKRRLTARGEKQAKKVALWLQRNLPRKRTVLVSPAERTQQTAHALELPYEIEPRAGHRSLRRRPAQSRRLAGPRAARC
jgi:phosphohistidine phosphatase